MVIPDSLIADDVISSDLDEFPPLSKLPTPPTAVPPAATTPAVLRQENRPAHVSTGPTSRKRMKSNWQLRLKSQQKTDQQKKKENKAKRQEAKARKEARLMRPRKKAVSQLADDIKLLNSSQELA